jgi:hypothetical protein
MKFRKIPSVVDAVQLPIEKGKQPDWIMCAITAGNIILFESGASMRTRDGSLAIARDGDWIVQGVHGDLYPVTDKVFLLEYDPITEENAR